MSALPVNPRQRELHDYPRLHLAKHRRKGGGGEKAVQPHQRHAFESDGGKQAETADALGISRREMVDEGSAKGMSGECRTLELERVEDVAQMLHQRLDRVLFARERFVGQSVSLELYGNRAKSGFDQRRHVAVKSVGAATPAVNEHHWRRSWIASFDHANLYSRAKTRKTHAVCRFTGGEHFAGTEIVPVTGSDHQIRLIRFLGREVFR